MKSFSIKTLFVLVICLGICFASVLAQDSKTKTETKSEPPEVKVEVKNDPLPPPPPTKESSPSNDTPSYELSPSSTSDDSSNSRTDKEVEPPNPTTSRRSRVINNRRRQQERRARQREIIEQRQREARRRNKEKNKEDEYYLNCPNFDPYGECDIYSDSNDMQNMPFNPSLYFGKNDVAYINYKRYTENLAARFQPYFKIPFGADYKPLYGLGFVEAQADLPYNSPYWVFYYEPDLDNFYIDFSKFYNKSFIFQPPVKFARLVIKSASKKTTKKVGKKFNYRGKVRPIVVENISSIALDRIYTFNLSYLPKGKYELLLISNTGDTVKLPFKIK